ncbi:arsenate reductase (glutaredoxin) [Shewanella sp. OPT22]|uniref:arsenate reductase (glutaredoxin) n=1 Tax=Parashewanella hymeniacidonis TaxID=2807618 RepID=UPI00101F6BE2|nr:arsenate reductase (glutaredoxin) [Parashewanella hymeniacidonis]MBM7073730.1 arsenate reductase (glutaredoxin) [Parashewanella hymeniacidonis]RYV01325.1 arsenate reductase (glutaredoxin) [Shewanella sp. OPT22]
MTKATIYHNPRCSKSRQTLALLEENNCEVTIVEYLKVAPSSSDIKKLLELLNFAPREMMRTKEDEYKAQNLSDVNKTSEDLVNAMVETPKLIERPIVLANGKAVIGRPPENVLDII